ncbi:response regulator [Rhodobacteraceae bacterium D3-12]|nr:response regulator [Rhodobacteraceae bacterium D3-12]
MDDFDLLNAQQSPTANRPLLGLTVLVVEDSRFACEAIRLMCLRSGARIRRADCLQSARRHLQVYRPSVLIVDLGLPDGSGAELITEMSGANPRVSVLLGTSGDDGAEACVRAAGADDFLAKPLSNLSLFQSVILSHLPAERQPSGPRIISGEEMLPDQVSYRDDLTHAAELLTDSAEGPSLDYLAQFVYGVARSAHDEQLERAARSLTLSRSEKRPTGSALARLAGLVQERLSERVAI